MGHHRALDMESESYDDEFLMEGLVYTWGVATGLFLGIAFSIGEDLLWHWTRNREVKRFTEEEK